MHYFSIATMFRNESHILKEWLDHYIYHGVDHFYLFDDYSDDNYIEIIQPYIDRGLITLYDNRDIPRLLEARQMRTYDKLHKLRDQTTWLAIIDCDEFIWSPRDINLKNILKELEDISSIEISMIYFGNNGNLEQPKYVVPSCTKRCRWDNYIKFTKCIIKLNDIINFGVHNMVVNGKTKNLSVTDDDPDGTGDHCYFNLNHYYVQSKYQFLEKKFKYQDETGGAYIKDYQEYLDKYNDLTLRLNEIDDTRLLEQNRGLYTNT